MSLIFACPKCRILVKENEVSPDYRLSGILDQLKFDCVNEGCQVRYKDLKFLIVTGSKIANEYEKKIKESISWGKMIFHQTDCKFKKIHCDWCEVGVGKKFYS